MMRSGYYGATSTKIIKAKMGNMRLRKISLTNQHREPQDFAVDSRRDQRHRVYSARGERVMFGAIRAIPRMLARLLLGLAFAMRVFGDTAPMAVEMRGGSPV
jgi:hypothetical protein